jgi:hypothetical protein
LLQIPEPGRTQIRTLMRLLEETVPVHRIWIDQAENPDGSARPFEGASPEEVTSVIAQCWQLLRNGGMDPQEAQAVLLQLDALQEYHDYVNALVSSEVS